MSITTKQHRIKGVILASILISLAGCSTYPNKFKCGDARGLGCTMLSEVDKQIDSGKIEQIYKDKKCRRGRCNSLSDQDALVVSKKEKASLYDHELEEILDDNNNLYF
jgi:hypothetical protein